MLFFNTLIWVPLTCSAALSARPWGCDFVVVWAVMDTWGRWQQALWERWPGSVGCCSWSINGLLSNDLHVTQESIYSLHLIHELQAGWQWSCSEMFVSSILAQPEALTAANELQGGARGRRQRAAINHILRRCSTVSMGDSWCRDAGDLQAKLLSGLCDIQHVARSEAINVFNLSLNLGGGWVYRQL